MSQRERALDIVETSAAETPILSLEGVGKRYGKRWAIRGVLPRALATSAARQAFLHASF